EHDARRDLDGRMLHGRADLYRQRTQPDDLRHRVRARRQDAELLRLHALGGRGAAAGIRAAHLRFFRAALGLADFFLAPPALGALAGFAGGSTAIPSISNRAPGRASCEIATVVLAGGAAMSSCWSRTSRKVPMLLMSTR